MWAAAVPPVTMCHPDDAMTIGQRGHTTLRMTSMCTRLSQGSRFVRWLRSGTFRSAPSSGRRAEKTLTATHGQRSEHRSGRKEIVSGRKSIEKSQQKRRNGVLGSSPECARALRLSWPDSQSGGSLSSPGDSRRKRRPKIRSRSTRSRSSRPRPAAPRPTIEQLSVSGRR